MKDYLTELLQHANKATKGNWVAVGLWVENEDDNLPDICEAGSEDVPMEPHKYDIHCANAIYIAAAQPKVIKALIREIRALRKQVANG